MNVREWVREEEWYWKNWIEQLFGRAAFTSRERGMRVVEEAIEFGQALKVTKEEAHALVEQVYAKPVGDEDQEAAGLLITLLCATYARDIPLICAYANEKARAADPDVMAKIKAKNLTKVRAF